MGTIILPEDTTAVCCVCGSQAKYKIYENYSCSKKISFCPKRIQDNREERESRFLEDWGYRNPTELKKNDKDGYTRYVDKQNNKAQKYGGIQDVVPHGTLCYGGCGQPAVRWSYGHYVCYERYGRCPAVQKEANIKVRETCRSRTGFDHPLQQVDKIRATRMAKYGVDHHMKQGGSLEAREKQKKSMLEKYGSEYAMLIDIEHRPDRLQAKYGVDNVFQLESVKKRMRDINIARWGVPYRHQSKDWFRLRGDGGKYAIKEYTLPSGRVVRLQGYEPQVLTKLLRDGTYTEDDFDFEGVPAFNYDDDKHVYHPDFYLPSDKLVIEVKSWYTYTKALDINMTKRQAVLDAGYDFIFIIYDPKTDQLVYIR